MRRMIPAYRLARSLRKGWDPDKAYVLADWCEEHGLSGLARSLRKGPSAETRARIDALAACFGDSTAVMVHWEKGWLPVGSRFSMAESEDT